MSVGPAAAWTTETWSMQALEDPSASGRKEIRTRVTRMDLEDTTLSGVSQTPKDRPGLTAFMGNVYKRPIHSDRKRVRGHQEWERRDGAFLLPDTECVLGVVERFWK